jgi:linoleate 10R-lipoxygenase
VRSCLLSPHRWLTWIRAGLKRGPDGRFSDEDISSTIYAAINTPAHAFGARSTPECMRVIEIMTIQQNRMWGTCTLNEFRCVVAVRLQERTAD